MKTLKNLFTFCFQIILLSLFISCGENPKTVEPKEPTPLSVSLDFYSILYMEADTFKAKIKRPPNGIGRKDGTLALKYRIMDDSFEMDGWQVEKKGNTFLFNQSSQIKFRKSIPSQFAISSGDSLGTLLMSKEMVNDILDSIKTNQNEYLVLVPIKNGSKVNYEVKISNSQSGLLNEFMGTDPKLLISRPIKGRIDDPIPPGGGGILNN